MKLQATRKNEEMNSQITDRVPLPIRIHPERMIYIITQDTPTPPIGRIRPIAMYNPIRNMQEAMI